MEISVIKSIAKQTAGDRRVLKRSKLAAIGMASVMVIAGGSRAEFAVPGGWFNFLSYLSITV